MVGGSALARIGRLMEMEPLYRPQGVEERWQKTWEAERLYHADPESGARPTSSRSRRRT